MPTNVMCIYCGDPTSGVRKGEHIFPEALGGTLALKCVCNKCNTGVLSRLDQELVSRSPLQVFTQQFMGAKGSYLWGYCPKNHFALEVRVTSGFESPPLLPQLVLLSDDWRFYADVEEMEAITPAQYLRKFRHFLYQAATAYLRGDRRPRLRFERIPRHPNRGHYPPRVYAQRMYSEFDDKMHFTCRHFESIDRVGIAKRVLRWHPSMRNCSYSSTEGVDDPETVHSFDLTGVARALTKIGLNLLAYVCGHQKVNLTRYTEAFHFVRHSGPAIWRCGFVRPEDVACLACPDDHHTCELAYCPELRSWRLLVAFFGGRLGAVAHFPGPRNNEWNRAVVTIPIKSRIWDVKTSRLFIPRSGTVSIDPALVMSSLRIRNPGFSFG